MPFFNTSKLITIDRHISQEEKLHEGASGNFSAILQDLMFAIRIIAREVRRAGLNDILGLTKSVNIHGEKVRRIDEYAQEVITQSMERGGNLCLMVSEESEGIMKIPDEYHKGNYVLAFDPLDGSTNMDVNITIGTIFSIYKRIEHGAGTDGTEKDILQPGYKQQAAGYALYGSSTMLVYTTGHGVNAFTFDPTIGEFLLTFQNLKMPTKGHHYSCNEGNYYKWDEKIRQYIDYIKTPGSGEGHPYTMRYIATAVADVHRMLHYGGIYLYPSEPSKPEGKIRLAYEANPLAMIIEQAGGRAITGNGRILDVEPKEIHQYVPFFVGSEENVNDLEMFMAGNHPWQKK
jgi:fructose-1,6-bisphosphatase I